MADARVPSVRLGAIQSDKMHSYYQVILDGVTIYCHERLPVLYRRITMKMEKFLFIKRLVAVPQY